MQLPDNLGYLTYCLNIHPTQTWPEARSAIVGPMCSIKAALSPNASFAAGLRFSAETVRELQQHEARAELKAIISENDLLATTVNGFPYGPFHGTSVKDKVYQPDWLSPARIDYTCSLADLMADLAPPDRFVSLSTVPGTFKPLAGGADAAIADGFLQAAAHCVKLRERTGVTVAIAIEPEPFCFLETVAETLVFFERYLFCPAAVRRVAGLSGLGAGTAADALRRHLGLCYDVCHAAVEFEDPAASIDDLRQAGVPIHKLQLSAALRLPYVTPDGRAALAKFDEPTYLHQVVSRTGEGKLLREPDLSPALARGGKADGEEWRVHFHVPIFIADLGAFLTTQAFLAEILAIHARQPISRHLEVETYTWSVLPEELRAGPVEQAIERELRWVLKQLTI